MAGAIPDIVIRLTADVDDFIRDWDRAADAAERAAARIRAAGAAAGDGPDASRFRDLNAELERLTRTARQAADSVRDLGNSNRRASDDVEQLRRRLGELGNGLGQVGGAFGRAGAGGKGMLVVYGLIASLLPGIIAGIFALGAAATGLVMAFGVAALGSRGLGQAFDRLQAAVRPLKAQLDSLFRVQLGGEFAKLGQTLTSQLTPAFKDVARAISDLIKDTTQWIRSSEGVSTIKTAMGGVRDLVRALSPAVKGVVQIFIEFGAAAAPSMKKIGDAISEVVVSLRDMFREANKSGQLTKIFEAGAEAIKGFGAILRGVIKILMEMASQGGLPAAEAMKKLGKALEEAAPLIGMVFRAFAENANSIMTVVGFLASLVKGFESIKGPAGQVLDLFVSLSNPISLVGNAVKDLSGKFEAAKPELDNFGKNVAKGFDTVVSSAKQGMDKTNTAIKSGWDKANSEVKQAMDKVNGAIKQGVDKAIAPVKQWWEKTNAEVKQGADKTIAAVKQWADKLVENAKQMVQKYIVVVKEWWEKTKAEVKAGVDKVIEDMKALVERIVDTVKELPDKMVQAGKDMVDGIIKGARAMAQQLIDTFKRMAEDALRAVKMALGIRSPSQVFHDEVGAMIPAGIAKGISGGAPLIRDALRKLPLNANVALSGGRGAAIGMGASSRQVVEVKLAVGSGGDGAAGAMIAGLARRGQLKITPNAIVGGRR